MKKEMSEEEYKEEQESGAKDMKDLKKKGLLEDE